MKIEIKNLVVLLITVKQKTLEKALNNNTKCFSFA